MSNTIIRSRAPLRISFGGGGTDVSPYADDRGGLVLNATLDRYAYVTIEPNDGDETVLTSLDYDENVRYPTAGGPPATAAAMDLALGVIRKLTPGHDVPSFHLYTHADCPPGSGLGASSTMVVALIGAFNGWLRLGLDAYEIARLAYEIEREDLGILGGRQDQYAAVFGGFNFMEFQGDFVLVNPLRVPPAGMAELEYSLVLAYTGSSRLSATIIENQIKNYDARSERAIEGMDHTKELAKQMKQALLQGKYRRFGELLHEGWVAKKKMSDQISSSRIDEIYAAARDAGALGGKISGAGGGGFMYFFTQFDRRHEVMEALEKQGVELVHFGFTDQGLQYWER